VDVLGGRLPGGQVLDFVVWAPECPIVISVNGDYWHGRGLQQRQETAIKEAVLAKLWGRKFKFFDFWTADLGTDDLAYETLRKTVGRGG
jgi:hypothetical protein